MEAVRLVSSGKIVLPVFVVPILCRPCANATTDVIESPKPPDRYSKKRGGNFAGSAAGRKEIFPRLGHGPATFRQLLKRDAQCRGVVEAMSRRNLSCCPKIWAWSFAAAACVRVPMADRACGPAKPDRSRAYWQTIWPRSETHRDENTLVAS